MSLLAVSEKKRSGLILCKEYHAEFAGPGAAVASSVEQPYRAVIAIGAPDLVQIDGADDRYKAYGLRIQWCRWLHRIADHPDATTRVERLFAGFEEFFGRQLVMRLPTEVLAMLVGVLPSTVDAVRRRQGHPTAWDKTTILFPSDQVRVATISLNAVKDGMNGAPLPLNATMQEIQATYARLRSA